MTGLNIWGLLFLGVVLYVVVSSVRDFLAGKAAIKSNWGTVLIEYARESEPVAFWFVTMSKVCLLAVAGYIGFSIVTAK